MQGEKVGEESGKVTSRRVLPNPGGGPKMETTAQTDLTLLGVRQPVRSHIGQLSGPMELCTVKATVSS
jgi:hypothetical protein